MRSLGFRGKLCIHPRQVEIANQVYEYGYRIDADPETPLDLALELRRWDFVDLLLSFGADPRGVDRTILFDTYNSMGYPIIRVPNFPGTL